MFHVHKVIQYMIIITVGFEKKITLQQKQAFKELADIYSGGHWIFSSAETGFNMNNALSLIVEQVSNDDVLLHKFLRYDWI